MSFPTNAVKAIIIESSKILIMQNKKKFWDLPGGLIEKGEENKYALKREVFEETSLDVTVTENVGSWSFIRSYDNEVVKVKNYLCEINNNKKDFQLSEEHIDYKWINPLEIAKFKVKDDSLIKSITRMFKKKTDENKA